MKAHRLFSAVLLAATFWISWNARPGLAAEATLAWDPSPSPDVTGYKIHLGSESGLYDRTVDVGNTTTATLQDLSDQVPTYIAATAYDDSGNESEYSEEVIYHPADPPDTSAPAWDAAPGICSAEDRQAGGTVTVEFGSATDDTDGANVRYNLYYAPTNAWDGADWANNTVLADITPTAGIHCANAFTVTGLSDGSEYTFGIRVADQSGNEDANTATATAVPNSLGGTVQFEDAFSSDVTSDYTVTQTWTQGGTGRFLYDAVNQRLQMLTGNDIGTQFARTVPVTSAGSFALDFLPTAKYPNGGTVYIRLRQDPDNYYEMKNTDGYGPGYFRKIVNGQVVDEALFQSEYVQNTSYRLVIDFSPAASAVAAFGQAFGIDGESTAIGVKSFEIELRQQDAYFDNIVCTAVDSHADPPPSDPDPSDKISDDGPPTAQGSGDVRISTTPAANPEAPGSSTGPRYCETDPANEAWPAPNPAVLYPAPADPLGPDTSVEIGQLGVDDLGRDLFFADRFQDPVLLTFPVSRWEADPFQVHVEELEEDRARLRLVEWAARDGMHGEEEVAYLVMASGHYRFEGGFRAEARKVTVQDPALFGYVVFLETFDSPPVVLAQGCGEGRERPEAFQIVSVASDGFLVLFDDFLARGADGTTGNARRICYVAVEPGSGTLDGAAFEAGRMEVSTDGSARTVPLESDAVQRPTAWLATLEGFDGWAHRHLMGESDPDGNGPPAVRMETETRWSHGESTRAAAGYLAVSAR